MTNAVDTTHNKFAFYELTVGDIRKETADTISVAFDVPEDLQALFTYEQGQHLTIEHEIDGESLRRSYSICTSVDDAELRITIKRIDGGRFSTWANRSLSMGDTLRVMAPQGHFSTPLDAEREGNYTAFAAGSGITPIMSIIKTTLEREPLSTFTLVYGNRTVRDIIFLEAFEDMKNRWPSRFHFINVLSREEQESELLSGRLDRERIDKLLDILVPWQGATGFFFCGPEGMVTAGKEALMARGVDEHDIHFELFAAPGQTEGGKPVPIVEEGLTEEEASHVSQVTVKLNGRSSNYKLSRAGKSLLDATLESRNDAPYACKAGVCCTCRAKVVEGEVKMLINYGLEEDEVEQGYVLTCTSHPVSDKVVLDYDN